MWSFCNICSEYKDHSVRPNGRPASRCKECQREYSKRHYNKNKTLHIKRAVIRNKERRNALVEVVGNAKNKPCMDCDILYPYYVMQFDHVRGKKSFTIGSHFANYSLSSLQQEIDKCDVVCANCHMERTHGEHK